MPKVAILFSESAVLDLEELKTGYAMQGVAEVSDKFVTAIIEKIETLRGRPDIGRAVPEFEQRVLRELIHPPFRIVYRHEPKKVRVVRVWRAGWLFHLPMDNDEK